LKETGRWRKGKVGPPMNSDVSERIHDRIFFVKGDGLIEGEEIDCARVLTPKINGTIPSC
jgi:hypothetical protein